jgi:hypothetical protein
MVTKYQIIQYKSKSSESPFGKVIEISHPIENNAPDCCISADLAAGRFWLRETLMELPDENEKQLQVKIRAQNPAGAIFDYIKRSTAAASYEVSGHVASSIFMQSVQCSSLISLSPRL